MNTKLTFSLAWGVCGLITLAALYGAGSDLLHSDVQGNDLTLINLILQGSFPIVFAIVGALIVSRQPRNTIGWLVIAPALFLVIPGLMTIPLRNITVLPVQPSILLLIMVWFDNISWVGFIFPLFFIALLFPTGKPTSPGWRWVIGYGIGLVAFFLLVASFAQIYTLDAATYGTNWSIRNPIGFIPQTTLDAIFSLWWGLALAALTVLSVVSLVVRYRRAALVEREQIKWVLYACGLFALIYVALLQTQSNTQGVLGVVQSILFFVGILGIPVAIGIAILRYNLYDINLIIRKTLVYSILTALLALVYFGGVFVLQQIIRFLTGNTSPIAIVLSTLAIAAFFAPLRRRVQEFIDRRFYRRKYDAAQALKAFSAAARDEVKLEKLTALLVSAANESMQPQSLSLWLMPSPKASHPLSREKQSEGHPQNLR